MKIEFDWCDEYLEYRRERETGEVPADLKSRLEGLVREYRNHVDHGRFLEARQLVRWLEPGASFILRDPLDDTRYECFQTPDGEEVRVVSAYAPEEVELEIRQMPEAGDDVVALAFPTTNQKETQTSEPCQE
ncbi:MAG: hypothetical protein ACOX9B_14995 [Candidatus Xenobium sp.]|nr:hypothetical protein [Burkholderiales bacterium]